MAVEGGGFGFRQSDEFASECELQRVKAKLVFSNQLVATVRKSSQKEN